MERWRSPPAARHWLALAAFAAAAASASLFPLRCDASACRRGCDVALASYYIAEGQNLTAIAALFGVGDPDDVLPYNSLTSKDIILKGSRVNVPFGCSCVDGEFLGGSFAYRIQPGDTYIRVAREVYHNLTTVDLLEKVNNYKASGKPVDVSINVVVSCFCGDPEISTAYGLFVTYPLRAGDNLERVAAAVGFSDLALLQRYNQGVNFNSGQGIVYVPRKDRYGSYHPLKERAVLSRGAVAGISIAAVVLLFFIISLGVGIYRVKKIKKVILLSSVAEDNSNVHGQGVVTSTDKTSVPTDLPQATSSLTEITMDKLTFSYEELAKATNNFSMANKIGEGGFGAVYYAELRGEKAAIKKMDMQATKQFLAELKVLAHVHHSNLVRLIGYCIQGSLFLVYEYVENGNLSQHLRDITVKEPLSWAIRVQIALDSARGLEYIHEHTVPVYIHHDIKSANILIDKNFRAKVADFGLAKLTEVSSASLQTRLVGTFGYMSPEYARYGDVSLKIDVYAFGVVLYELISAKEAVVRTSGSDHEPMGLVSLFERVLRQPDPREDLRELVDPRLGDEYSIECVHKLAQLAKACTEENPHLRPSMRSIVVALMTLSSSTDDWDAVSFYENKALVNLMSGR